MISWLLDHIQFVIIVGVMLASWVKATSERKRALKEAEEEMAERAARRAARQEAGEPAHDEPGRPSVPPPLARKKATVPPPVGRPAREHSAPPPVPRAMDAPAPSALPTIAASAEQDARRMLEQQARLMERYEEAKRASAIRERNQRRVKHADPSRVEQPASSLRGTLRQQGALRRAMVLKEILGPPVSLR